MKKLIPALLSVFLYTGCKTVRIPVETTTIVKETIRDTVLQVKIEKEFVMQEVRDTTSTVETKYAKSTATWCDGTLKHSIENKTDSFPVRIQYVDRTVEVERPAPYPVEVEVPVEQPVRMPLRWWEKILVYLGATVLGSGVLWLVVRYKG